MLKLENENFFAYEMIGEFISSGTWIHPRRIIKSYELIYVLEGTVFIAENNIEYQLHPNDIIILEPNKEHFGYENSIAQTSFYWFHFLTDLELPSKVYKEKESYDLKYLLRKLLHIANTTTYPNSAADTAGLLIFQELMSINFTVSDSNRALINKIKEYVRLNLSYGITVSKLAAHFGYNSDYISKLFKKAFNIGLKEYIADQRIKFAKDLLLTTNLSIKEISGKLNFKSENLFIKYFMYHEEISPTKFRNTYCNTHMNNQ